MDIAFLRCASDQERALGNPSHTPLAGCCIPGLFRIPLAAMTSDPSPGVGPPVRIEAVILDFGGVLWDMRWDVARQLSEAHGLAWSSVFETLYRTDTWHHVERGRGDAVAWLAEAHAAL